MFMQFKRDVGANTSRSFDICMVRGGGGGQYYSSFFPISYQKITITGDGTPGTSWVTAPVIITLY